VKPPSTRRISPAMAARHSRELTEVLVHVDVGIDDPQLLGCLAGTARLRCWRIAWHPKII